MSASLGSGDTTINVADTSGTPGVPFYVVIDPDDDSKREVVGVDQGKTGTTLTLSSSAQRGLDGTSDVAHDSNAVIGIYPIAAYWTDINDRVDQHAHGGGSDGASVATADLTGHDKATHDALALDHGSLSGLSDFTTDHGTAHDGHDHEDAIVAAAVEISDHDRSTGQVSLNTTSAVTLATVNLTIPASWSTGWTLEAHGSYSARILSGGVENNGTTSLKLDGSTIHDIAITIGGVTFVPVSISGRTTSTTTGSVDVTLEHVTGSAEDHAAERRVLVVRARRTT